MMREPRTDEELAALPGARIITGAPPDHAVYRFHAKLSGDAVRCTCGWIGGRPSPDGVELKRRARKHIAEVTA